MQRDLPLHINVPDSISTVPEVMQQYDQTSPAVLSTHS